MSAGRRDLLLKTLRGEATDRVPWVPYVGCHGGSLIGRRADDYLRDPEAVAYGLTAAAERYRADGLPVVFDLQVEAEALGCELVWAERNPPAVSTHPLAEGATLDDLKLPAPDDARYPMVLEATRLARRQLGAEVALFGLITGPFTLALHLLGAEIFVKMFDAEEDIRELLAFCGEVGQQTADWYLEAGCDVIAVVDPMTSQISPDHFEQFVTLPASRLFTTLRGRGVPTAFFVCGDAQRNVVKMCESGPSAVFVDENIDLSYVGDIARRHGIAFGGNIPLTTVMLHGTPDDNRRAARQCLDLGGATGYILAPGCDLPYDVPPENCAAIAEVVHGEHSGEVAGSGPSAPAVEKPDYAALPSVRIDIFTLDSAACAPCQYMVEAVEQALPEFAGAVHWVEHKLKDPATVGLMGALQVKSIPSIAIGGEVKFSSIIPELRVLREAIAEEVAAKQAKGG